MLTTFVWSVRVGIRVLLAELQGMESPALEITSKGAGAKGKLRSAGSVRSGAWLFQLPTWRLCSRRCLSEKHLLSPGPFPEFKAPCIYILHIKIIWPKEKSSSITVHLRVMPNN